MNVNTIKYDGEEYVILPKNAYNTLVHYVLDLKQIPATNSTNDQVSLEEKATNLLAKGGAAL